MKKKEWKRGKKERGSDDATYQMLIICFNRIAGIKKKGRLIENEIKGRKRERERKK